MVKWQVGKMTSWWNDKLVELQVDEWQVDEWQVDEMTSWWNDMLVKLKVD